MSVQRIKLLGLRGGGFCCGKETIPTIDRSFPSILRGTDVTQHSWTDFCDQSDSILEVLQPIKKRTTRLIFSLLSFLATMVMVAPILITQVEIKKYLGAFWSFYFFIFVFILPCFAFFRIKGYASQGMNGVFSELTTLCANKSSQFPGITFRFTTRRRTNGKKSWNERYIDIIVTGLSDENDNYTVPTDGYLSTDDSIALTVTRDDFEDRV